MMDEKKFGCLGFVRKGCFVKEFLILGFVRLGWFDLKTLNLKEQIGFIGFV